MDRRELIEELAPRLGGIEKADAALSAFVDIVVDHVAAGGRVAVTGFGTFEPAARAARVGRNPRTGESVHLPPIQVPKFRAGRGFKDVVADPRLLRDAGSQRWRAPAGSGQSNATNADPPAAATRGTRIRSTFIVTWNPDKWHWDETDRQSAVDATAEGHVWEGQWATGNRKGGIQDGDRVFLLKQGPEPRGVIASGHFRGEVFQEEHWDESQAGPANYAPIDWDVVLPLGEVLPLSLLKDGVAPFNWEPPAGGIRLPEPLSSRLEKLWAEHVVDGVPEPSPPQRRPGGQGWQNDPIRRRLVEDHAQALLEQLYRADGWEVSDTRHGNPFDAIATKGPEIRYLEAKGTETDGFSVTVTPGEVAFASSHPGQCVIGVVAGVRFTIDGELDRASGKLVVHDWNPEAGVLQPTGYRWTPPASRAHGGERAAGAQA